MAKAFFSKNREDKAAAEDTIEESTVT